MILSLLAATALAGQPVEAAERAFAAMAQTKGQWTAFRAYAAPDANMLVGTLQPAAAFLADRADPPSAVMWWPARTYTSCDGTLAFSTGPYRGAAKEQGQFFTIWARQPDGGWKWVYDGGGPVRTAVPAGEAVRAVRAGCRVPKEQPAMITSGITGASADGTLRWSVSRVGPKLHRVRVLFVRNGRWEVAQDTRVEG
jgi:ketosteroid isomerase-like protein